MRVLAIDQGTTGTTTAIYDRSGQIQARSYREFTQIYPQPGWVEHDPEEIWRTVVDTVEEVCAAGNEKIVGVGITNQRETTLVWDKRTGQAVHNAIVWQCRRTAEQCEQLKEHEHFVRQRTGLPLDAYFSGTKIRWILDQIESRNSDNLLFGTIDSWLIWKLTGGAVHATDHTNAARTLLFDIHKREWDPELCELLQVPLSMLPQARPSLGDFGTISAIPSLQGVKILGVAGDQQAALFGQNCFEKGQLKNTYGTGCFAVMNTGDQAILSQNGLVTTLAVAGNKQTCFALEGSVFIAGAAIQWLRDELGLLQNAADSEDMALQVADSGGVYLVPAFAGLGAPHWNMQARGLITGLTRGANRNHLVRATLEALAYQTLDVVRAMEQETGVHIDTLTVDGGACENDFLMQFQADILDCIVARPENIESTSLGAAYLAGLQAGVWDNTAQLTKLKTIEKGFTPNMEESERQRLLDGWRRAVRQCLTR